MHFSYSLIQIHADRFGLTLILLFYGMYLRYLLILLFPYCFGTQVFCLISLPSATEQKRSSERCFMVSPLLAGQAVRSTGNGRKASHWFWPVWQLHLYCQYIPLYPSTLRPR